MLVTGAGDFIGGHCCRALLDTGCEVMGIDNCHPVYDRARDEQSPMDLSAHPSLSFDEAHIRGEADPACAVAVRQRGITPASTIS